VIAATYDCSVDGEEVALHEIGSDRRLLLDALASRYSSEAEYSPCAGMPFPTGFRVVAGDRWVVVTASVQASIAVVDLVGGTVQPTPDGGGPPISYQHPGLDCR
jgi:hypothetical protein